MTDLSQEDAATLSDLERRLRLVEDQLTIHRIVMTHPPAADTGDGEYWHLVLGEHGRVDYAKTEANDAAGLSGLVTADQLAALTTRAEAREAQRSGLVHFATPPIVVVTGDTAEAWNYHQTLLRIEGGFRVFNLFANYWAFTRSGQGWQVTVRKVRLTDGHEEAIDILRDAVAASSALLGAPGGA